MMRVGTTMETVNSLQLAKLLKVSITRETHMLFQEIYVAVRTFHQNKDAGSKIWARGKCTTTQERYSKADVRNWTNRWANTSDVIISSRPNPSDRL